MSSFKTIIGLNGYARSGKDTVGDLLCERGFRRLAFADALRDALYALDPTVEHVGGGCVKLSTVIDSVGWEGAKIQTPEVRELLQRLGTEVGREQFGGHFWVDLAMKKINESSWDHWVLTDVRFPNEYNAVVDHDGYMLRIERPGFGPANTHLSEVALDGYAFHYRVENTGTIADLRHELTNALEHLSISTPVMAAS